MATIAQKRFAQGLAMGKSQAKAYKLSHPNTKMTGNALATRANLALKSKAVKEELERLLAEPMLQPLLLVQCPEFEDHRKLIEHAVGVMVRLTTHDDPIVQMHAAVWLYDYGRVLREEKKQPKRESREKILENLRAIYAKSLPQAPLIVESEGEVITGSEALEGRPDDDPPFEPTPADSER